VTLLEQALDYLHRGYSIIPLSGKKAIIKWEEYQHRLPTEPEITSWFKDGKSNIGIITGKVSGILVLDVDGEEGQKFIQQVDLPLTSCVKTGLGGNHFYFRYIPENRELRNFTRRFPGIDLRAEGGYVVAPPSLHPVTNEEYIWEVGLDETPLVYPPQWLLDGCETPEIKGTAKVDPLMVLEGVPEGMRDETLFKYACRLQRQGLKQREAEVLVLQAAQSCDPPFPEDEAKAKVRQAFRYPSPTGSLTDTKEARVHRIGINAWRLCWEPENLAIEVSRHYTHHDGTVKGEILIQLETHPGVPMILHQSQFNFSTAGTRRSLAKQLTERYADIDWNEILEQLCRRFLQIIREGEPTVSLYPDDTLPPVGYHLYPFVPMQRSSILFGDGGTGKSYLALLMAVCIQSGWSDNPLGFQIDEPHKVLYLDWETEADEIRYRISQLRKGTNTPTCSIEYRRCDLPLYLDIEQVQSSIVNSKANMVVIDSLAQACGGNLNDAEVANRFFASLRQVRVTSLVVAHTAKGNGEGDGKKTVYGSVFYQNNARNVWELRRRGAEDGGTLTLDLIHRKSNLSRLHKNWCFKIYFEDGTRIERAEIDETVGQKILSKLQQEGKKLLTHNLIESVASDQSSVRAALYRLRDRGVIQSEKEGKEMAWWLKD
jgi:hypothetical protein